MKANILYLAELYVGKCKIAHPLPPKITLSFRIGKNMAQATQSRIAKDGQLEIDTNLQLNTDQLALDTQRSSLTLSCISPTGQITVFGMALIPLSRDSPHLSKKFRLTQCPDKNAEIELTLTITPLDSVLFPEHNNLAPTLSSGVSSSRSLMEMQEFEKKAMSPPRLFTMEREKGMKQAQSAKEVPLGEDLRESVSRLQGECQCLKELLKVEIKKSDASNRLIDSLVSALEEVSSPNTPRHDLDETLLLEGIDRDDSLDKVLLRNAELEKEVASLHTIIEELRLQNKNLQRTRESTRVGSRETLNSLKELPPTLLDSKKNQTELAQLESEVLEKMEEMERYKKKMKLATKVPTIEPFQLHRYPSPISTIRHTIERLLQENKELMRAMLRLMKQEADSQSEGFLTRLKQRIERSFNSLLAKKMNRDIVLFEKSELLKGIEELWQKCS